MTEERITVWPEDEHVWIVSFDDMSSDTLIAGVLLRQRMISRPRPIAVFDNERDALAHAHEVADATGLRLHRWDALTHTYVEVEQEEVQV